MKWSQILCPFKWFQMVLLYYTSAETKNLAKHLSIHRFNAVVIKMTITKAILIYCFYFTLTCVP